MSNTLCGDAIVILNLYDFLDTFYTLKRYQWWLENKNKAKTWIFCLLESCKTKRKVSASYFGSLNWHTFPDQISQMDKAEQIWWQIIVFTSRETRDEKNCCNLEILHRFTKGMEKYGCLRTFGDVVEDGLRRGDCRGNYHLSDIKTFQPFSYKKGQGK